ncbi:MAG: glycosyltransferase family 1 protein [Magnetococcales bacterium]|nr:glycosyltransferase family 1 protein [Magnetococcales bacterium]
MSETKEQFKATLKALNGDVTELIQWMQGNTVDPNDLLFTIYDLFAEEKNLSEATIRTTFLLAMMLANSGYAHPLISLARCAGGLLYDNPSEMQAGLDALPAQMDHLVKVELDTLVKNVLDPILTFGIGRAIRLQNSHETLRVLEILKAAVSKFRSMFDWSAPVPVVTVAQLKQQGREKARLVTLTQPPTDVPFRRRHVLFASGQSFVPPNGWTTQYELPIIIGRAFRDYGWEASIFIIDHQQLEISCRSIVEICRHLKIDILLCNENSLYGIPHAREAMMAQLRSDNPEIKIVSLLMDGWAVPEEIIKAHSTLVDAVWPLDIPGRELWDEPIFRYRTLRMPTPYEGILPGPVLEKPLAREIGFIGRVSGGNWHRAFWLAAAEKMGLPLRAKLTPLILSNATSPLDNYREYLNEFTEATCGVNFIMRPDHSLILTGRCFEILWSGALLFQEWGPDTSCFLVSGEHYLEFSSLTELASLTTLFLKEQDAMEQIRRDGHHFMRENYGNRRLIGHMDYVLYHCARD